MKELLCDVCGDVIPQGEYPGTLMETGLRPVGNGTEYFAIHARRADVAEGQAVERGTPSFFIGSNTSDLCLRCIHGMLGDELREMGPLGPTEIPIPTEGN